MGGKGQREEEEAGGEEGGGGRRGGGEEGGHTNASKSNGVITAKNDGLGNKARLASTKTGVDSGIGTVGVIATSEVAIVDIYRDEREEGKGRRERGEGPSQ
jgi:hypothetical protein